VIALAIRTGIPMSEWEQAGPRAIRTAFDILANPDNPASAGGPQMSG